MSLKVLYEDNHLMVVQKPPGVLVQGDATQDLSLFDMVKDYLKVTYHKPGNVFLGLVHRLDRPVGGVVVFAKTSKGASRLSEQFRSHSVKKEYDALVVGRPSLSEGTLVNYLVKDEARNVVRVFNESVPGALRAELKYKTVHTYQDFSLLKIELLTGRPHQIRAQMAAIGCPLVGDVKYGGPPWTIPEGGIALQSGLLSFDTATSGERKTLTLPVPDSWLSYVDIMKRSE